MSKQRILSSMALGLVGLVGACSSDGTSSGTAAVQEAINDCEDRLAQCEMTSDECELHAMDCVESVDGEGATEDDVWKDCEALHDACVGKTGDAAFCEDLRQACLSCVSGHDDEDSDSDSDTDYEECHEQCGAGGYGCDGPSCDGGHEDPDHHGDAKHYGGDFDCDGAPSFYSFDNVYVRYGDACELDGKKVYGSVYVEEGGSLFAYDTHVVGNIQSYGATGIEVSACTIEGNVQIKATHCEMEQVASIKDSEIYGNLQVEENYCAFSVSGNTVHGDLQFFKNYAESDHTIYKNAIKQNLQCKESSPYPIQGGENRVYGNAEDQCYELAEPW